jgi:hypothetical protein
VSLTTSKAVRKGDFRLDCHGDIYLLHPLNASGRKWVEDNVCQETGVHPYFPTIIVEPRFLPGIMDGIRRDRLVTR